MKAVITDICFRHLTIVKSQAGKVELHDVGDVNQNGNGGRGGSWVSLVT